MRQRRVALVHSSLCVKHLPTSLGQTSHRTREALWQAGRLARRPPRLISAAVRSIELVRIFICAGAGTRDTPSDPTQWVQRPGLRSGFARFVHSRVMRAHFLLTISSPAFGCGIQFR